MVYGTYKVVLGYDSLAGIVQHLGEYIETGINGPGLAHVKHVRRMVQDCHPESQRKTGKERRRGRGGGKNGKLRINFNNNFFTRLKDQFCLLLSCNKGNNVEFIRKMQTVNNNHLR